MSEHAFSRQSFLGEQSQLIIEKATIGIVGLGGGGSQIIQQLAHIGFLHYVIYDPDSLEDTNLNRLVGATDKDVAQKVQKIEIATRLIKSIRPFASIQAFNNRWQDQPESLRTCDIIFGCVDGFAERRELEVCARRYLIPYLDIGMDVHCLAGEPPRMGGQVILSMPGGPCMHCLGFLNERTLAQEAALYGDAGNKPQVIWPNAILASTAVGLAIDLLTDWTKGLRSTKYFEYDGNQGIIRLHPRLAYINNAECPHFPINQIGDPF